MIHGSVIIFILPSLILEVEDSKDMLAFHTPLRLVSTGAGACLDVHRIVEARLIEIALEGG